VILRARVKAHPFRAFRACELLDISRRSGMTYQAVKKGSRTCSEAMVELIEL
jgi:hypothetical protein